MRSPWERLAPEPSTASYVNAVIAAYSGNDSDGMSTLETVIRVHAKDSSFLYNAACAYSLAAREAAKKETSKAKRYADRAVELLKDAVAYGNRDYRWILIDSDLDPIREHPGYVDLLKRANLDRLYTGVWHNRNDSTSTELHGLDPVEHLARIKSLIAQGYRPASLSVAETETGQRVTASVWHRPANAEGVKDARASRQANAALALLKMNQPVKLGALLKHSSEPGVRSYLIQRLGRQGGDAMTNVKRLETEPDVTIRRALILSLGEFGKEAWKPDENTFILQRLRETYRTAADPGLHAAAEWLLRQWHEEGLLDRADQDWAANRDRRDARIEAIRRDLARKVSGEGSDSKAAPQWYVNGQGQTMVVLPAPMDLMMGSPTAYQVPTNLRETNKWSQATIYVLNQHHRQIDRAFAIAAKPVTLKQYLPFHKLRFHRDLDYIKECAPTDDCPAHMIDWYAAAAYCNWLSEQEGIPLEEWCYETNKEGDVTRLKQNYLNLSGYRLPTEAEWEYACRAGAVTSWHFGESQALLQDYACFSEIASDRMANRSRPVGSKKPNDLGLFDMHGNVWCWCQESYKPYPTAKGDEVTKDKEDELDIKSDATRVLRGGSFLDQALATRSAVRLALPPTARYGNVGFRVARTFR